MSSVDNIEVIVRKLAHLLAWSLQAIQAAVFVFDPDAPDLDAYSVLCHIHGGVDAPDAGIVAFQHYLRTAIRNDVHMANPMEPPVFCLVALIGRDPRPCGAFAVAIRATDQTDADRCLAMLVRLTNPPPAPPADDLASLWLVMHHLADKISSLVQGFESVLFSVDHKSNGDHELTVLTHAGQSNAEEKLKSVGAFEGAARHNLKLKSPRAYKTWPPYYILVYPITQDSRICGMLTIAIVTEKDPDIDANKRLRKLTGPMDPTSSTADLIVYPAKTRE